MLPPPRGPPPTSRIVNVFEETKSFAGLPEYNICQALFEHPQTTSVECFYSPLHPQKDIKCTVPPRTQQFVFMLHGSGALYTDVDAKLLSQWDCFGYAPMEEERTYTLIGGKEGGGFVVISDKNATKEDLVFEKEEPIFPTIVNSYISTKWEGKGIRTSKKATLTSLVDTNMISDKKRSWNVTLECLLPGTQSSHPHAHSAEDEFCILLAGKARYWCHGEVPEGIMEAGDCVGWKCGTAIAHSIINDADGPDGQGAMAVLLTWGESKEEEDKLYYPTKAHDRYFSSSSWSWKDHGGSPIGNATSTPGFPRSEDAEYPTWEASPPIPRRIDSE